MSRNRRADWRRIKGKYSYTVEEVARALNLHRNTVRQRLRRIAQLTGADLGSSDDRLALHMALLGREALAHLS